MRLAIMQPYFFPYIGYFQLIAAADKFILYDNLCYIKKGWINRNRIRLKGRDVVYCSVPVRGVSSFAKIRDVKIDYSQRWPGKFLDLISFNYRKAPFFDEVFPVIENAVSVEAERIGELNCHTVRTVAGFLGIATEITDDISPYQDLEEAVRNGSEMVPELTRSYQVADVKSTRVIYICKKEDAQVYINAIGGKGLYYKDQFARNGIELHFVESSFTPYDQFGDEFAPGLSVIDVLMHCGREGTQRRLKDFRLI